jgi:hypothetical protein
MAIYQVYLMGQSHPLTLDLPYRDLGEVVAEASRAKFLAGHMPVADDCGVCRAVMVATGRIQCVIEAD